VIALGEGCKLCSATGVDELISGKKGGAQWPAALAFRQAGDF